MGMIFYSFSTIYEVYKARMEINEFPSLYRYISPGCKVTPTGFHPPVTIIEGHFIEFVRQFRMWRNVIRVCIECTIIGKTVYNDGGMDILPVKEWKLILQDILDTLHQNRIPFPFR
jgi:hypothetical protein